MPGHVLFFFHPPHPSVIPVAVFRARGPLLTMIIDMTGVVVTSGFLFHILKNILINFAVEIPLKKRAAQRGISSRESPFKYSTSRGAISSFRS